MKSCYQTLLQALFCMGIVITFSLWQHNGNTWDFMVYAQQWPEAACVDINNTRKETCFMDKSVKTWTVHGIWPSREDGKSPFYCNNSNPFIEAKITDLESEMMARWPNLIERTPKCDFWKHEWIKHGTCATSLHQLSTEHLYFQKALDLNLRFDYKTILEKSGIVPSKNTYKLQDIRAAIEKFTASHINIQCFLSVDKSIQAIVQIEVCLNKDFTTRDCVDKTKQYWALPAWDSIPYNPSFEQCKESMNVLYIPLTNQ